VSGGTQTAREQWRDRAVAASALLLAGMLCWQAAGVLRRERDHERAVTGVTVEWHEHAQDVRALGILARQREAAGDAAGVVELTRRVLWRRPLDASSRLRLALALAAQGEHELARRHADRAARIARNHPELMLYCARVRWRAWVDGGDLGALREALAHFRDALARDHRLLGKVRDMLQAGGGGGPEGEALGSADNLRSLIPDRPEAWREAGRVFAAAGEWEAAADAYRRAGNAGQERSVEALARAQAEARSAQPERAVAAAAQAVEVARPAERAQVIRSAVRLLRGLGPKHVARGEALCEAWAARWPAPPVAQTELAEWRLLRGDEAGALGVVAALSEADRETSGVLDLRGRIALRAERPEMAETYFRRALQQQRSEPGRWLRLVHFLEQRSRIDDALALADQARQRHPDHAGIRATRDRLVGKSVGVPPPK
jgi:tetratricopeptide (TPR) repeat protein